MKPRQLVQAVMDALAVQFGSSVFLDRVPSHIGASKTEFPYVVVQPQGSSGQQYTCGDDYTEWRAFRFLYYGLDYATALDQIDEMAKLLDCLAGTMASRKPMDGVARDPDPAADGQPVWAGLLEIRFQVQRQRS